MTCFHKVSRALLGLHVSANLIGSLNCRVDCGPSSDQESIIFLRDRRPPEKVTEERLTRAVILTRPRVCRLLIPGEGRNFWWSSYVVLQADLSWPANTNTPPFIAWKLAGMCKAQKDLSTEAEWVSYTLQKTAVLASVYIL